MGTGDETYAVADILRGGVLGHELGDDGGGEDAEGVGDEVIAEPGEGWRACYCRLNISGPV